MPSRSRYWFPAKRYGWGWGLPVAWQGWLVLAVFFGLVAAGMLFFRQIARQPPLSLSLSFFPPSSPACAGSRANRRAGGGATMIGPIERPFIAARLAVRPPESGRVPRASPFPCR